MFTGVPDAIFAHPRLVRVYDAFDGVRDDLAAYLDIVEELGADRVLDVGCGTACLALLLAEHGVYLCGSGSYCQSGSSGIQVTRLRR
jgi:SAM-dependent methyltransferase